MGGVNKQPTTVTFNAGLVFDLVMIAPDGNVIVAEGKKKARQREAR